MRTETRCLFTLSFNALLIFKNETRTDIKCVCLLQQDNDDGTHTHVNEVITGTATTSKTTQIHDATTTAPNTASDKQKAVEHEMLPKQGDWTFLLSGIVLVGVFVAFFLWLGGERCLRRLVKGKETRYSKLRESDP